MNKNISATQSPPPDHPLDFHTLRREGIRHIERLGSTFWTDYNSHDPGITILEQLCYALTDLLYRIDYPVPDLLAEGGEDPYANLFPPSEILPSEPVTLLDLRKLVIDFPGVKNAWVEQADMKPAIYFYRDFYAEKDKLGLRKEDQNEPLRLQGLYQIWVEPDKNIEKKKSEAALETKIRRYLQPYRSLGEDFIITVLNEHPEKHIEKIKITTALEIDKTADSVQILQAVVQKIEHYFSPPVRFYSLQERLEAGKSFAEIFEGPLLTKGFVDDQELEKAVRRTELRTSDLIRLFMDIKGVLAVHILTFNDLTDQKGWLVQLKNGLIPRLDKKISEITIIQGESKRAYSDKEIPLISIADPAGSRPLPRINELPHQAGRDRHIKKNYSSIQHQFPDCYGIGSSGLPASASSLRKAQMKQLKAYLLLFDQLLVNQFTQLANAGQLFSFLDKPEEDEGQIDTATYFTQILNESELGLDDEKEESNGLGLWTEPNKPQRLSRLDQLVSSSDKEAERKNRFLDHLLARFGEQVTESLGSRIQGMPETAQGKIKRKIKYLYSKRDKQPGKEESKPLPVDQRRRLEQRIRLKLGMQDNAELYLVEHILLRPLAADKQQSTAILELSSDIPLGDPYSLRVSVVLPLDYLKQVLTDTSLDEQKRRLKLIKHSILKEIPAHLIVNFPKLDEDKTEELEDVYENNWLVSFKGAYQTFQELYQDWYPAMAYDVNTNLQKLRAARDRLIDLLDFGRTYPLSDLKVNSTMPTYGKKADISIPCSQPYVTYQLCDEQGVRIQVDTDEALKLDNGKPVTLKTPAIEKDMIFRILAYKNHPVESSEDFPYKTKTFLDQAAVVKVGLNTGLSARIFKEIDTNEERREPTPLSEADSHILIHYKHKVIVQVDGSQEGVLYRLFRVQDNTLPALSKSDEPGTGNEQSIELESIEIDKDINIHIEAEDTNLEVTNPERHQWLKQVLPLRVRAKTDLSTSPSSIVEFDHSDLSITLNETEDNVFYQAFQRQLRYDDFIFEEGDDSKLSIPVENFPVVKIKQPEAKWKENEVLIINDYSTIKDTEREGHGQALNLPIDSLKEDSLIIIRAAKKHKKGLLTEDNGDPIRSEVQLSNAVVLLVQPNPD
ncbi:MAG: hypothetical protein D3920_08690, partial [Candidatus Electrothrix sp. AW2]|nr:hypothetical protein [Candidatus Electrothrix gigas]